MKKNKILSIIKKMGIVFGGLLAVFSVIVFVLYFLPNEVTFKIYNAQAIAQTDNQKSMELFEKAQKIFPGWSLIAKNNSFGILYEEKKYDELTILLDKIIQKDCSVESQKISVYCENIFYLNGLTQYKLGENKETKEQIDFFQKAIDEFQKTLAINTQNTWAQENIDFIMQKSQQTQSQQENKQDSNDGKKSSEQENKQDGNNSEESSEQENNQQQTNDKDKESEQKSDTNGESRLSKQIQEQLEQYQQQLDQEQSRDGFNRSKSAAEKNNLENKDPFEQMMSDPMLQQLFGNNSMMQNMMDKKQLDQTIKNPNEKDW